MMIQNKDVLKKVRKMGLRPARRDGVLVLLDEIVESKTKTGILLLADGSNNERFRTGTVIGVGNEVKELHALDRVLLSKYLGLQIMHDDSYRCRLVFVSEDQIDAIME